jgi:olefin beta-lactone synthetase
VYGHRLGFEHQLHRNRVVTPSPNRPDGARWRRWGIDPSWSRVLDVPSHDGGSHRWHLLDTGEPDLIRSESKTRGSDGRVCATIVCVHGNPTWAYAWKTLLTRFAGQHRVIAIDQLSMGYSERVSPRRYVDRVNDLADIVDALGLDPNRPLVVAAHDWGGAIAMGWAVDHADLVAAMVLCNTGIGVPPGRGAPKVIRLAASAPLRDLVCRRTSGFVEGTVRLSGKRITKSDREAFRAPYRRAVDRRAIADFVGDVPLTESHPSAAALARVSGLLPTITAPVLLAWGADDIVFDDDFAADLANRLPNANVHRFADANHLVMAEADVVGVVDTWLNDIVSTTRRAHQRDDPNPKPIPDVSVSGGSSDRPPTSVFDGIDRRRDDTTTAIYDAVTGDTIDFATFAARVDRVAATLLAQGLVSGDRVAMLTPPGVDLLVVVYGVWRAGGVTVIADRGLGLRGLGSAISSARPAWVIGPRAARLASVVLRWSPRAQRIDIDNLLATAELTDPTGLPRPPDHDAVAAVLFTSGATGPAKGVLYRHGQLAAQRDALATTYGITDADRLVAAFAPFALYGPALGVPTAFVDCDVTTPGELTVAALDAACMHIDATMAFASPAALANVARTARAGVEYSGVSSLRLVFSAGAPVPAETLAEVAALAPIASLHTPYGMTEALPITDIDFDTIAAAEGSETAPSAGVCVGMPVDGAEVMIAPLRFDALDGVPESVPAGELGEILVRSPWVSDGYLGRWQTQRISRPGAGWHRTGDVGQFDAEARLWVDGRAVHVIETVEGPIAPVPTERAIERALTPVGLAQAGRVAAVGVGPVGCQQLVIVIERPGHPDGLADDATAAAVRRIVIRPVAAVLIVSGLPVDVRHNAKIDRSKVGAWADELLSGDSKPSGLRAITRRWRRGNR